MHDVKIGIGSKRKNPAFDGVMKARDIVKTSKSTVNCTSFYQQFRCDVQVFGDRSENVFVLMNHNMEWQTAPLVSLACDAVDCILEDNDESLILT